MSYTQPNFILKIVKETGKNTKIYIFIEHLYNLKDASLVNVEETYL